MVGYQHLSEQSSAQKSWYLCWYRRIFFVIKFNYINRLFNL